MMPHSGWVIVAALGLGMAMPCWAQDDAGEHVYDGAARPLRVSFEYPTDWEFQEGHGAMEPYAQVRLIGPRNGEGTYSCYIVVRHFQRRAQGRFASAQDAARYHIKHLPPDAKMLSQRDEIIGGHAARSIIATYTIPALHKAALRSRDIPVRQQTMFLEQGPSIYEITFSADSREYLKHLSAFSRLLQTFAFPEGA
jgi:hypothetical protein